MPATSKSSCTSPARVTVKRSGSASGSRSASTFIVALPSADCPSCSTTSTGSAGL
ncbi:hypothetical protein [Mangrovicoccus ximenensis]|uniref:hypothetical protein n=1 Tax=Mangrovicoccus ximenensis TaxID=1911570 RepID=UPI001F379939|nr:hypothetical protein [Mangrovicoccus ximenensis]